VTVQRFFNAFTIATNNQVTHVHLLFQCAGGNVADSICLYNFFQGLPIDLTPYNAGSVQSGGVIAFLGAKHRKCSTHATFMIHRTWATLQAATADRLKAMAESLLLDDERTERILGEHVKIPQEKWETHKAFDLWFSADEACSSGLATEIGEFAPPVGTTLFTIGPP
jgi:ATP-dependent Clp protease protease subunit